MLADSIGPLSAHVWWMLLPMLSHYS